MRVGDTSGAGVWITASTTDTTQTVGMAIKMVTAAASINNTYLLTFGQSNLYPDRYNARVAYDSTSNRFAISDRTGTVYTGVNTAFTGAWYYIELQVVFHQTAGSWEFHVDGVSAASASTRDTLWGTEPVPAMIMCGDGGTQWIDDVYIDNIYYLDSTGTENTTFLGVSEVGLLLPSGNGTTSDMTGSDADKTDNYLLVDENPADTADYVESATEGDLDTYAMDDLTGTPAVRAVMTTIYAQKDDTGAKFLRPIIRSGTGDYAGTSHTLSNGVYVQLDDVWDVDPYTGLTWAYTAVNAMEVGQEVRDS